MTKWTPFFLGLIICVSCSRERTEKITWSEGDWIYLTDTSKFIFDPRYVGLRFRDDTVYRLSDQWLTKEGKYQISNDTIIVFEESDTVYYKILKMTSDTLDIFGFGDSLRYYNRELEFDPKLRLNTITLEAGTCFGDCAEFKLIMTDKGEIEFTGTRNSKFIGETKYQLNTKKKGEIDSLFQWTNISKIDTTDFYGADDDWLMTIKFDYNDNQKRRVKGTNHVMPFRLKRIIWILLEDLRKRELV